MPFPLPVPEGMSTNIPPLITEWETYSQGDMTWEGLEAVADLSKDGGDSSPKLTVS